jgi:uncharacterized membrane protein
METRLRSLVKTLIYRAVAIITIATLTWYFTGNAYTVTLVVIIYNAVVWSFYYIHERIWDSIQWGRIKTVNN